MEGQLAFGRLGLDRGVRFCLVSEVGLEGQVLFCKSGWVW